jgi:hypothetical protein
MEIGWSGENHSSTGAYILRAISARGKRHGPEKKGNPHQEREDGKWLKCIRLLSRTRRSLGLLRRAKLNW